MVDCGSCGKWLTATDRLCHDCATAGLRAEVERLREVAINLTTERNESWDREHEQRKLMREVAGWMMECRCRHNWAVMEQLSASLSTAAEEE